MADDPIPQRRAADKPPSAAHKLKDRALATSSLVFSLAFLYQLSEILRRHSQWAELKVPAGVGEILFAVVCGLAAVATAWGIDIDSLIKGFKSKE